MSTGKKEFDDSFDRLGKLYEEGKVCLHNILPMDGHESHDRLFYILQEMRDLAAINIKKHSTTSEN